MVNITTYNELLIIETNRDATVRFYLENDIIIEAWYDPEFNQYTWSNAVYGCAELKELAEEIDEFLRESDLKITEIELI